MGAPLSVNIEEKVGLKTDRPLKNYADFFKARVENSATSPVLMHPALGLLTVNKWSIHRNFQLNSCQITWILRNRSIDSLKTSTLI